MGQYNSPESLRRYDQIVGEWIAQGQVAARPRDEMSVAQMTEQDHG